MNAEPADDDALAPEWEERFRADLEADERSERLLLIKTGLIVLIVAVLVAARLILV